MYSFLYAQEIKIFDLFLPSFASCPFASEECLVLSWLQPRGPRALHTPRSSEPQGLLCRLLPGRCQRLGLWQYPKRCTSSWSTTSLLPLVSVCLALFARGTAEHCSAVWVPLEGQQPPSTASQPDPDRLGALGHHPLSPVVLTKFFCHLEVCPSQPYRIALTSRMLWKIKLKT